MSWASNENRARHPLSTWNQNRARHRGYRTRIELAYRVYMWNENRARFRVSDENRVEHRRHRTTIEFDTIHENKAGTAFDARYQAPMSGDMSSNGKRALSRAKNRLLDTKIYCGTWYVVWCQSRQIKAKKMPSCQQVKVLSPDIFDNLV